MYSEALKRSRLNQNFLFTPQTNASKYTSKNQRKSKTSWFSPPFSQNSIYQNPTGCMNFFRNTWWNLATTSISYININYYISYLRYQLYTSSIILLHNKKLLKPRTTEYGCNSQTRKNLFKIFKFLSWIFDHVEKRLD